MSPVPKKRVVIAGLGDTGVLVAIYLGTDYEVVGISPKPCLVSGQELGTRLTRPGEWKEDYLMSFDRYEKLDHVKIVQGTVTELSWDERRVAVTLPDGRRQEEGFDALVISSGVVNGFWRLPTIETREEISAQIEQKARELAAAGSVAVVGGGATGVSVAANLAEQYPGKEVHLFYSHSQPLPGYHPKVRKRIEAHLRGAGVHLHPGHRAVLPAGFDGDQLTRGLIEWTTGQGPFEASCTLWAVGRVRPNSAFLPRDMLDDSGFVEADATLEVPGYPGVFTVGDIAATDPHRSSARNWAYRIAAHNIRVHLDGAGAMKRFEAPKYKWGSILGVQKNGMRVFQPSGSTFRFPRWLVKRLLFPIAVRRAIYRGVRRPPPRARP